MTKNQDKRLFPEFPAITTTDWEEKINIDLKGADYEKKLIWKTIEGFNVKPYYTKEDLKGLKSITQSSPNEFPYLRGNKNDNNWLIRQDIYVDDVKKANPKALNAIKKGAESIGFIISEELEIEANRLAELLKALPLENIELNFSQGQKTKKLLLCFVDFCKSNSIDTTKIKGSFDFDPLGYTSITGQCYDEDLCKEMSISKPVFENAKDILPGFQLISVNGKYYNNAGASVVQELAFSLSVANDYLTFAAAENISVNDFSPRIKFNFAVGSNYFMEIAKLRAAKLLWAKIVEAHNPCCAEKGKMYIHSETSEWNKTIYDPYVNMLRTTTEAMSASLGGTDSLTVLPFDHSYKKTDEFSERIARNQQIVLKKESYFDKVADPAAGSYYIENLTNSIIDEAWKLFLEIEDLGGYLEAFKKGKIQDSITETAQKRDMNIAMRKDILLGTNQYPNQNETLDNNIQKLRQFPQPVKGKTFIGEPLKIYRAAEAFEKLRLKTEENKNKIPSVFLFTYGNLTMRKARAAFSSNFFACAGFNIEDNFGFETVEKGIEAAKKSKAKIVVICSSDDEYETIAPKIFQTLKGDKTIVVAGYPKKIIQKLEDLGIKYFIHIKSNALEMLKEFQELVISNL
ncbi:MAG: methylmalonyl-CoA mutase family protein [Bacteroidota bacterium]